MLSTFVRKQYYLQMSTGDKRQGRDHVSTVFQMGMMAVQMWRIGWGLTTDRRDFSLLLMAVEGDLVPMIFQNYSVVAGFQKGPELDAGRRQGEGRRVCRRSRMTAQNSSLDGQMVDQKLRAG